VIGAWFRIMRGTKTPAGSIQTSEEEEVRRNTYVGSVKKRQQDATPFRDYERQIRQQFTEIFARSGFDAGRDIAGIILNRWGHAYLSPAPGFFFGRDGKPAPSDVLRTAPFGRISFANTDLAGVMDHRYSILEADRAVAQLLDQVLSE